MEFFDGGRIMHRSHGAGRFRRLWVYDWSHKMNALRGVSTSSIVLMATYNIPKILLYTSIVTMIQLRLQIRSSNTPEHDADHVE